MARYAAPNKSRRKTGKNNAASASTGENRTIFLILAGFTALVIAVIAIVAIVNASGSDGAGNFTPNNQGLIPVGEKAPGFSAKTVDGGKVSLTDQGGKEATMLVFFATWCPHCQKEAPVIDDFENEYQDLRIVMVDIDGQDNPQKVRRFVNEYGIESPAVFDQSLGAPYNVSGYPTVYILDGKDEVVFAHSGEAPREVFERNIEKALG